MDSNKNKHSFFGEDIQYWIGKIVSVDDNGTQRTLMTGGSWGYRYRVRLVADYSNQDTVDDDTVFVAQALVPLTAGTGGADRSESIKLSQGDMVLGIFMGFDRTAPFILHAFTRVKDNLTESGFNNDVLPGLQEGQETSGTKISFTPKSIDTTSRAKGNGKGREVPFDQLRNLAGGTSEDNEVDVFSNLSGTLVTTRTTVVKNNESASVNLSGLTREQVEIRKKRYKNTDIFGDVA